MRVHHGKLHHRCGHTADRSKRIIIPELCCGLVIVVLWAGDNSKSLGITLAVFQDASTGRCVPKTSRLLALPCIRQPHHERVSCCQNNASTHTWKATEGRCHSRTCTTSTQQRRPSHSSERPACSSTDTCQPYKVMPHTMESIRGSSQTHVQARCWGGAERPWHSTPLRQPPHPSPALQYRQAPCS